MLVSFEACPRNHCAVRVRKTHAEKVSPANEPGKAMHAAMESHIKHGNPLPPELRRWGAMVAGFKRGARVCGAEMRFAVDRHLRPVAFFAPDVWCRAVADVAIAKGNGALYIDWKTGKVRHDPDQGKITAMVLMAQPQFKAAEFIRTYFVFTNAGEVLTERYDKARIETLADEYSPRVAALAAAFRSNEWPERPSWKCRFCPVTECQHHPDNN